MQVENRRDRPLSRPAHATVVAYLALFVALGGSATALKGKNTVRSDDIKRANVRSSDIARGAVKRNKIASRAVNARRLAPRSVTTSRLVPAAVVNRIIGADAITSDKILDGAVTTNDVAPDAIGGGKIKKQAVGSAKLKAKAVTEGKLADGAVTAKKLGSGSIPIGKLSSPVVTAGEPAAQGLDAPLLEFVRVSHAPGPIATIPGIGTYTGVCAGGASIAYANGGGDVQQVITDDSAGTVSGQTLGAGEAAMATTPTDAGHVTIFSHRANGASAHAEIFATHDAGACSFYLWALAR